MSRALTTNQPSPTGRKPGSERSRRASSAIVVHHLDVVAVRVEDEGGVVARVVHGALAGGPVVAVAGLERRPVEVLHGPIVVGAERQVQVLRRRTVVDERERRVRASEVREAVALVVEWMAAPRRDELVEARRLADVRDPDPEMVERPLAQAAVVNGLDAVAVGVEEE